MAAPRKRSKKKMSHAHLQDLAVLCAGLLLLVVVANLIGIEPEAAHPQLPSMTSAQ